jgi:Mrp family chromosome partitioning ATPase/uncharacterized protein involved in exopolysaccharide biosynthesis
MSQQSVQKTLAENIVEQSGELFSLRRLISKVFLRPKLFLLALLLPPIIATTMALMVPPEWAASTKILIRYNLNSQGSLSNLTGDTSLGLSGATSAELLKSKPVLEKAIDSVGITEDDIYQESTDVIKAKILSIFSGKSKDEANAPVSSEQEKKTALINSFKGSLESSGSKSSNENAIAVLEKTSQTPESLKIDELITLQVKSFNRSKVDDMANGLAQAFIEEYNKLYLQQAKKRTNYLNDLIYAEEELLQRIEAATPETLESFTVSEQASGGELLSRDVPLLASMATALTESMTELSRLKQVYAEDSPRIQRLESQISDLRFDLKKQERIEISKQMLERLKSNRFKASNAEKIYQNALVPISIVEFADEPKASQNNKLVKVIASAVIGIILGTIFAISIMIVLNVIDPRVHQRDDIEEILTNKIIAYLPKIKSQNFSNYQSIKQDTSIADNVSHLFSSIARKSETEGGQIIAFASTTIGEGCTFISSALALNIAKDENTKVCLVDLDFNNGGLTKLFQLENKPGVIDTLLNEDDQHLSTIDSSSLQIFPVGNIALKNQLGLYSQKLEKLISILKSKFDYILLDSGSVFEGNESTVMSAIADESILISASGLTRKGALKVAVNNLQENSGQPVKVVLNQMKKVLPGFIYNTI